MPLWIIVSFILVPFSFSNYGPTTIYTKEYYTNGTLKAEGWMMDSQKVKYWKFYDTNEILISEGHYKEDERDGYWHFYNEKGITIREGHYKQGNAQNWWIIYDLVHQEKRKIQYENNLKNGFCLIYIKNKLSKVEKYNKDVLKGQWTSIRSFRHDNPEVSLFTL